MLDRGLEPIEGRVWFVSHVVTVGNWMAATFKSDEKLFRFIAEELDLGQVPAILYDPRSPEPQLRVYRAGLGDAENCSFLYIAYTEISIDDIFWRIDAIYRNQLVTPGVQSRGRRLWKAASRGLPERYAEVLLRNALETGLQGAFPMCKVRTEQSQPAGRLDIEIEEGVLDQPGIVKRHAILEIKVLREMTNKGKAVARGVVGKLVKEGVIQAAAYRDERVALAAALCCFDMRSKFLGAECFLCVNDLAAKLQVHLRCWHLFASAAAYRRYLKESAILTTTHTE